MKICCEKGTHLFVSFAQEMCSPQELTLHQDVAHHTTELAQGIVPAVDMQTTGVDVRAYTTMLAIGYVGHTWQSQKYRVVVFFYSWGKYFWGFHNQLYYRELSQVKFRGKQGLSLALLLQQIFKNDISNMQISTEKSATLIDHPVTVLTTAPLFTDQIQLQA